MVDANGIHGLVCKHVPSRVVRHHGLYDCISRAFSAAGIPVKKEPAGLARSDGKRPDSCTLISWQVSNFFIECVTNAKTLQNSTSMHKMHAWITT